jgi:hypothetical protein
MSVIIIAIRVPLISKMEDMPFEVINLKLSGGRQVGKLVIYNMQKSKKERKREKIEDKERDFKAPMRRLHYEEYQIPPYSQ